MVNKLAPAKFDIEPNGSLRIFPLQKCCKVNDGQVSFCKIWCRTKWLFENFSFAKFCKVHDRQINFCKIWYRTKWLFENLSFAKMLQNWGSFSCGRREVESNQIKQRAFLVQKAIALEAVIWIFEPSRKSLLGIENCLRQPTQIGQWVINNPLLLLSFDHSWSSAMFSYSNSKLFGFQRHLRFTLSSLRRFQRATKFITNLSRWQWSQINRQSS